MQGAERDIAINNLPERLAMAQVAGAKIITFDEVGAESHATASFDAVIDKVKAATLDYGSYEPRTPHRKRVDA